MKEVVVGIDFLKLRNVKLMIISHDSGLMVTPRLICPHPINLEVKTKGVRS